SGPLLRRALLEREHHAPEERLELALLLLGERLAEQRLLLGLDADRRVVETAPLRRQPDEHGAPVGRLAAPLDQARLLELVEAVRHRAAREVGDARELA